MHVKFYLGNRILVSFARRNSHRYKKYTGAVVAKIVDKTSSEKL